jgi:serine/threonine-protein kinase
VTRSKNPELEDTAFAPPAVASEAVVTLDAPTPLIVEIPVPGDSLVALSSGTPFGGKELVAGRYEILALLGIGGMGAVYRVKDTRLDELVALKMLRGELVATPGMQRRFHDEVKLARKVTHRNVARTFDIGDHEGTLFLTMELLDGESLGQRMEREGALAINHAIDITIDVANALEAAHVAGVVHRDLKPDNVFLTKDGRAVVTDFGIARAHAADDAGKTGGSIGTPAYMAPEQIEGLKDLDGRTDLYALGEVLYEMVCGVRAWPATNPMASLAQRLTQPPPDPRASNPNVSEAIASVIERLLARKREERFARAAEVVQALASARSDAKPGARPAEKHAVPRAQARGETTVAVLPFKSHGAPDWVSQGLLEDLIDTLSMTRGLRVRPVGVVEPFVDSQKSARDIGRELGVSVVVEGSIRALGPDLRLSTRAIGVEDGFQIWAQRWQRPASEILGVSDEAAMAIANALTGSLNVPERGTQEPLAAEMYLRARADYRASLHARETLEKVTGLFDAAVSLAPKDPHVLSGAALAYARLAFFSSGTQMTAASDRAHELADAAIAIAPHLGDSWVAVATLRNYEGNYPGAARALTSALELAPNTPKARELMGRLLLEIDDVDDGIQLLNGALELDPSCIDPRWDLSRGLALRGDVDSAREILDRPCGDTSVLQRSWMRVRLACWYPDERAKRVALEEATPTAGLVGNAIARYKHMLATGTIRDEDRTFFEDVVRYGTLRIRLMAGQAYVEFLVAGGMSTDGVLPHVRNLADDGLLDIAWIDRCPLLVAARKDASWPELRKVVEERAQRVRAAMRE